MIKIICDVHLDNYYLAYINTMLDDLLLDIKSLNLTHLKAIKIIDDGILFKDSDGHFDLEKGMILFQISNLKNYIDNDNYDILKSIIFHELCHVDLYAKIPSLHKEHIIACKNENYIKSFTIMVYIEYLAHIKSCKYEKENNIIGLITSINKKKWDFNNEIDLIYFVKYVPYVLGKCYRKEEYLNKLSNEKYLERISEFRKVLCDITNGKLINNYDDLKELENIVKKYIHNY